MSSPTIYSYSITVRVVGLPSEDFDGTTTTTFAVVVFGTSFQEKEQDSVTSLAGSSSILTDIGDVDLDDSEDLSTFYANSYNREDDDNSLQQEMEVAFYHCESGWFWAVNLGNDNSPTCELCVNIEGDAEVCAC